MSTAIYTAASGMAAAQKDIDLKAHNIANIRTPGFKKFRLETADLSYQNIRRAGIFESADAVERPVGIYIGLGTKVVGAYRILTRGNIETTGNPLDVAIQGPGYFAVNLANGVTGYTRNGSFKKSATGELVTTEGYPLVDGIQLGNIPEGTVSISSDGVVAAPDPNNRAVIIPLGQIQVHYFVNEQGLEPYQSNFLIETAASGVAAPGVAGVDGRGTLLQNSKEESNTDPTTELTALIMAQRAYELNSKVIKIADEAMKSVTDMKP
jgi:flagellar basal-body rod protein FlgG